MTNTWVLRDTTTGRLIDENYPSMRAITTRYPEAATRYPTELHALHAACRIVATSDTLAPTPIRG